MSTPPRVVSASWGSLEVEIRNRKHKFKDCILTPLGTFEWDWKKNGTSHVPGIVLQDVRDIIRESHLSRPIVIIFGVGFECKLQLTGELLTWLEDLKKRAKSVSIQILNTKDAISLYNDSIKDGVHVFGFLHSTC